MVDHSIERYHSIEWWTHFIKWFILYNGANIGLLYIIINYVYWYVR